MTESFASPLAEFLDVFRLVLVNTEADQLRAYALRHRVFCEELGYFNVDSIGHSERDAFDPDALHCLIEHRGSGIVVGYLRVVSADSQGSDDLALPAQRYCASKGVPLSLEGRGAPREQLCEISRIAIPRYFRTQGQDDRHASALEKEVYAQHAPHIFQAMGVALNLCATSLSGLLSRHHVLALIEPRFHRLLARAGLRFEQVSGFVEYYGSRATYYIDQRRAVVELSDKFRTLYEGIDDALGAQFHASPDYRVGSTIG